MLASWKKGYDKPRQHIKRQGHHFADRGQHSQRYGFSRSHVWIWELDSKEGWVLRNWCFWIVILEKDFESPWTARRSNQSILKEINSEYLLERTCWSSNILAIWWEDPIHWKRLWCWGWLRAGGKGTWQRVKWLDSINNSTDVSLSKPQEIVKDRKVWRTAVLQSQRGGHDLLTEQQRQQNNFTRGKS